MKFIKASAIALLVAAPAFAGGMSAPVMEATVIEEEATTSSRAGILVPILAIILIGIAISNNNDAVVQPTG